MNFASGGVGRHVGVGHTNKGMDVENDLQRALNRITLSGQGHNDGDVNELATYLQNQLNLSNLSRNEYALLAEQLVRLSMNKHPSDVSETTHPTVSASDHEGSTDLEFSVKDQPTTVRTTWSSDSQSSRGLSEQYEQRTYNCNDEAQSLERSQPQSTQGASALLNQLRRKKPSEHLTSGGLRSDRRNAETDGQGGGGFSCASAIGRHKRTPSKQGARSRPKKNGVFGAFHNNNNMEYVSQVDSGHVSPEADAARPTQQSAPPLLSRIICGKSQRVVEDQTKSGLAPNGMQYLPASVSDFSSFNPSFPEASSSPIAEERSTTPSARRPQMAASPRPGLQEKEEQERSTQHPSPVIDRLGAGASKTSPKINHFQSPSGEDGTQQPSMPRVFSSQSPSRETTSFTSSVQTVMSQTSVDSLYTTATPGPPSAAPSDDDDDHMVPTTTPYTRNTGTPSDPMDFSPIPTMTPVVAPPKVSHKVDFSTAFAETDVDPYAERKQYQRISHTPAPESMPHPLSHTPAPPQKRYDQSSMEEAEAATAAAAAAASQIPPMHNGAPAGFSVGAGGSLKRRLNRAKVRVGGVNAVHFPKVGGEAVGVSSSGSLAEATETTKLLGSQQPRPLPVEEEEPVPMSVEENFDTQPHASLQMPNLGTHPDAPFTIGKAKSRFKLPQNKNSAVTRNIQYSTAGPTPENSSTAQSQPHTEAPLPHIPCAPTDPDYSGVLPLVNSKRQEARDAYMRFDYRMSIKAYSVAIQAYTTLCDKPVFDGDTMAVLYSNRAAALMMLGALSAAVDDCRKGIQFVLDGGPRGERFSSDCGPPLKLKLQARLARALLRQGLDEEARLMAEAAIQTADKALEFSRRVHTAENAEENALVLAHMKGEAELGLADAIKVQQILGKVRQLLKNNESNSRWSYAEPLNHVNLALSIANGSNDLLETKLHLLTKMKRWREAAGVLERLAALNVRFDGVFVGDLQTKYPFPGVGPAQNLSPDFFGECQDEDLATCDKKLNSKVAGEAAVRMPYKFARIYVRALRLEERYPAADAAIAALETLAATGGDQTRFDLRWLPAERDRLERTKAGREKGDELFRNGQFELAAKVYADSLVIDNEVERSFANGPNAGGRLHAVLHCNRAACLMALRNYEEALEECSYALRIHSRYMKAMLRRARCYSRLFRYQESISEYSRWLELVEEARNKSCPISISACLFDGPGDAKDDDIQIVKNELDGVHASKRRAEAAAREESHRREQDRKRWNDTFSSTHSAQQRREEWHNQTNESRRWDSFRNRGPSRNNARSYSADPNRAHDHAQSQGRAHSEERSSGRQRSFGSPGVDASSSDHYAVLHVTAQATEDEIKKAYKRLALKYHPDKNSNDGANEKFHRIRLARDVLMDPVTRREYDLERRRRGH